MIELHMIFDNGDELKKEIPDGYTLDSTRDCGSIYIIAPDGGCGGVIHTNVMAAIFW